MKFDQDLCKNFDMTIEVTFFIRDEIAQKMFKLSQRCMIGGLSFAVKIDESMIGIYTS